MNCDTRVSHIEELRQRKGFGTINETLTYIHDPKHTYPMIGMTDNSKAELLIYRMEKKEMSQKPITIEGLVTSEGAIVTSEINKKLELIVHDMLARPEVEGTREVCVKVRIFKEKIKEDPTRSTQPPRRILTDTRIKTTVPEDVLVTQDGEISGGKLVIDTPLIQGRVMDEVEEEVPVVG